MAATARLINQAQLSSATFTELVILDSETGRPVTVQPFQREWHQLWDLHRRLLIFAPNNHGKTTNIISRVLWEIMRNHNIRIKIVCQSDERARDRIMELKRYIQFSPELHKIDPELRPGDKEEWTKHRFIVQRSTFARDPTVEACGITSSSEGGRADLLIFDDPCDFRNTMMQPGMRNMLRQVFYSSWFKLLEPNGRVWVIGTPVHKADLYHLLMESPEWTIHRTAVPEDLTPLWPEKWPREKLAQRKREMPPREFARAFHLLALSDEDAPISAGYFQFWTQLPEKLDGRIIAVDPAISLGEKSDYTAIVMLHVSSAKVGLPGIVRVENVWQKRLKHPEQVDLLASLYRQYKPLAVIVETVAYQTGLKEDLQRLGIPAAKAEAPPGERNKPARANAIALALKNGTLLLRGVKSDGTAATIVHPEQEALFDELVTFPVGEHDDLLDALAYALHAAQGFFNLVGIQPREQPRKRLPGFYYRDEVNDPAQVGPRWGQVPAMQFFDYWRNPPPIVLPLDREEILSPIYLELQEEEADYKQGH